MNFLFTNPCVSSAQGTELWNADIQIFSFSVVGGGQDSSPQRRTPWFPMWLTLSLQSRRLQKSLLRDFYMISCWKHFFFFLLLTYKQFRGGRKPLFRILWTNCGSSTPGLPQPQRALFYSLFFAVMFCILSLWCCCVVYVQIHWGHKRV